MHTRAVGIFRIEREMHTDCFSRVTLYTYIHTRHKGRKRNTRADIVRSFYIISVSSKYISCVRHVSYIIFPTRWHRVTKMYVCVLVIAPVYNTAIHTVTIRERVFANTGFFSRTYIASSFTSGMTSEKSSMSKHPLIESFILFSHSHSAVISQLYQLRYEKKRQQ